MKWIFLLLILVAYQANSACTSATRSAFTTNQVLTSSRLNSEFNNALDFMNAYDGGCINSGSLEAAAMNSTEFAPLLKSIVSGCETVWVDTNTVGVSKCKISVDGNLFETSSQNNITWGCSGCASEATGSFFIYIKDSTTFTPLISTTAPGADGYNGTDKVVGSFYNDSSLDIATGSMMNFVTNGFLPTATDVPRSGQYVLLHSALISSAGVVAEETSDFISGNCTNANPMVCTWVPNLWLEQPKCMLNAQSGATISANTISYTGTTSISIRSTDLVGANIVQTFSKDLLCIGKRRGI